MLLRTAIIDDDKVFCDILSHYISKIDLMELEAIYHDIPTVLNDNRAFKNLDLVFLDVELPGMTGIEFLETLENPPQVIIVSGKKEYGADAFDYNVLDYLKKPVSFSRFVKAVNKIQQKNAAPMPVDGLSDGHLFVRCDGLWKRLAFEEIQLIKGHNNSVVVKTEKESFHSPMRMKEIFERLPAGAFMQVHRSYIVNLNKIDKVDGEILEINKRTIPVSRTYIRELYERLHIER
ncbi:MAG: response regulator transcription factor [Flavobacteriales bacterium]|nr:response regulator transcription factor [Flavobacteriales bacterium]